MTVLSRTALLISNRMRWSTESKAPHYHLIPCIHAAFLIYNSPSSSLVSPLLTFDSRLSSLVSPLSSLHFNWRSLITLHSALCTQSNLSSLVSRLIKCLTLAYAFSLHAPASVFMPFGMYLAQHSCHSIHSWSFPLLAPAIFVYFVNFVYI